MFVVVRRFVNIDGQVFSAAGPGKDADVIPKELESKLTAHDKKVCLQIADDAFPDWPGRKTAAAPAVAPKTTPAPIQAEVK